MGTEGAKWDTLDILTKERLNQKTVYIGTSEPTTMYAGMIWYDSTNNIFKERNAANDNWVNQINQNLLTTSSPTFAGLTVGSDIISDTADTDSLGSTSKEWLNLYIGDAGKIYLGLSQDVNLYRSAANVLKTDDHFIVGSGSIPSAGTTYRGSLYRVEGATGVADKIYCCMKGTDDAYTWVQVAIG